MTDIKFIQVTKQLIQYNDETIIKKKESKEREFDFFEDIKPFVCEVDGTLEGWKKLAFEWVRCEKPKYIHPGQIEQVYENLQNNALHCFAKKTNEKRFYETHQAILYTLQSIVNQCK